MLRVKDIRNTFIEKYLNKDFVIDKTECKTIEIVGATFLADESYIVRPPNYDYVEREISWYISQSLEVKDIPGKIPTIWKNIASTEGRINSNYGWCIWSEENGKQYENVLNELKNNRDSRRAAMIYNRPSMHQEYNKDGMSDFMCTFSNQFFIRDGKLISHYIMRSNDAVFGFNNDRAWAKFVQQKLASDLGVRVGELIWTACSLHIYERHFNFIEEIISSEKFAETAKN